MEAPFLSQRTRWMGRKITAIRNMPVRPPPTPCRRGLGLWQPAGSLPPQKPINPHSLPSNQPLQHFVSTCCSRPELRCSLGGGHLYNFTVLKCICLPDALWISQKL